MILHYIIIGAGGACGAIARVAMRKLLPVAILGIPVPILFINISGCFFMGLLTELMALHWSSSDNLRYFLVSGFLGGFTTFSAFALEFGLLYEKHEYLSAIAYALLSLTLSVVGFFVGIKLVRICS